MFCEINDILYKFPFTLPSYFTLLLRTVVILEGIALKGDPEYDIYEDVFPHAAKRALGLFGVKNIAKIVQAKLA